MILRKIPKDERPMWLLKVTAGDLLMRRRADWGLKRKWEGNYLAQVRKNNMWSISGKETTWHR